MPEAHARSNAILVSLATSSMAVHDKKHSFEKNAQLAKRVVTIRILAPLYTTIPLLANAFCKSVINSWGT